MNAINRIYSGDPETPGLDVIDMPWGFRIRPADTKENPLDAVIELALTSLGVVLILTAFGQWIIPGSSFGGGALTIKLVLTCVLGLAGGITLSASARGFRPEVQVDRARGEIRFVSRNPRGRGKILAEVELATVIGVGITKSIDGPDCHCLIYMIDGRRPLRIASGTEREIRGIREMMNGYVTSPEARAKAKKAKAAR